jgi:hypothetical protein
MKYALFWDIEPCSPYMSRRFGGLYHLHLQGRKSAEQDTSENKWLGRMSSEPMGAEQHTFPLPSSLYKIVIPTDCCFCLHCFLARLIFYPEDGNNIFIRNVGSYGLHGVISQKMANLIFIDLI